MHLKYLEIQGFKSFPDRTRVTFEEGYTGVVGPNGSGKSNLSDAIKWVLGEQSSKSLRGGKMEDVVFGGTQLRKPMGYAQVSLCLDNADGRIADVGAEIVVTRRYYRSGDSEYIVNGSPVRLRDVREMFMDTGLGKDGYSIISQGKIAEIVSAKSDDRRELFEEASGIAKYRFRKNEAAKKLDAAQDNLSRLRDILDVMEQRIEPLREQSEKAETFLALAQERKGLEITLYCDTIDRSRENLRRQDDKLEIARQDYARAEQGLEEMTARTEQLGEDNRRRNVEIEQFNSDIFSLNEQIAALESEIAVGRNDASHASGQIAELEARIRALSESDEEIERQIAEKETQAVQKGESLAQAGREIARAQQGLDELVSAAALRDKSRADTARRLSGLQAELTEQRVARVGAESASQTLGARARAIEEQLPALRERRAAADAELRENQAYLEAVRGDISDCENRIRGYSMKLTSRTDKLDAQQAELARRSGEISEITHKISVLQDMEKNMEGFQHSVRRVAEAAASHRLRGVVGTVASLLSVRRGCELAVETALGAAAQNIVVEDERAAKDAIAFLKDARAGRATFLPLDTIKPGRFDGEDCLQDSGVVGLASALVSCDARYQTVVSYLLGRIVVAEELNSASALARKLRYRYRIVTMDGQVINAGGSYTGGSSSRQAGLFGRKVEIEQLEARAAALRQEMRGAEEACESLKAEAAALEAEITAINSDLITHNEDRVRVEEQLVRQQQEADGLAESLEAAQRELAQIEAQRAEKESVIREGGARAELLAAEIARLESDAGEEDKTEDDFLRRRAELAELISQKRIEQAELQKDVEALAAAAESLRGRKSESGDAAAGLAAAVENLRRAAAQAEQLTAEKAALAQTLRAQIAARRADIERTAAARTETERQINELRAQYAGQTRQREEIGRELSRLEERKNALTAEFDATVAKLWEEYEMTQKEAQGFCVPFDSITELRAQVAGVRAKIRALGTVNVAAIEEYKQVTAQWQQLTAQVGDVERSKEELLRLIAELESEMRVLFTASFSEISRHFRQIFVELFGGGQANLSLTDGENVLESGIEIDVQPPGKVIKNLSALSGGEQALVAIALYFSILAVNPSPFCVLDEIDSALDESNVNRFAAYLARVAAHTQIIAITHRRGTMESADVLYGVTMQEEGVSKVLKLGIEEAQLVISK